MSNTSASREILLVCCYVPGIQYCERIDVALPGERYSIGAQTARTLSFEARYSSVPAEIYTADVPKQAVKIGTHARQL
jgi:hypothetical protein